MKKSIFSLYIIVLMTVFGYSAIEAQDNEQIQDQCDAEQAQFIVAQQVSESSTVTDRLKKIKILTVSADFMWDFDEPKAREYFTDAYTDAFEYFREKGIEREKVSDDKRFGGALIDPRFDVIKAVAKRDGNWARELTEKLLKEFEEAAKNRQDHELGHETSFLLSLATENLETNPDLSWFLFRRVMKYPASYDWARVLAVTAAKRPDIATALYSELLNNYSNSNSQQLLFFSAFPFATDTLFGPDRFTYMFGGGRGVEINPALQAQFLNLFLNRIMTVTPEQLADPGPQSWLPPEPVYMYLGLNDLEPYVLQYQPSLIPRLQAAKSRAFSFINDKMNPKLEQFQKRGENQSKSFEDRIRELEEKEDQGKLKDFDVISFITMGNHKEHEFRVLESWLAKIKEESPRKETAEFFWFNRSRLASTESRFSDADTYASRVNALDFKAVLAFYIVEGKLKNEDDPVEIYQILGGVSRIAQRMPDDVAKVRILLGLTHLYKNTNRAFAINELSSAVQVINRLAEPNLSSNVMHKMITTKDYGVMTAFPLPGHNMEGTFREISKLETDLPLSNARSINDNYLRTLAVIAIAKSCVERAKEKEKTERPTQEQ